MALTDAASRKRKCTEPEPDLSLLSLSPPPCEVVIRGAKNEVAIDVLHYVASLMRAQGDTRALDVWGYDKTSDGDMCCAYRPPEGATEVAFEAAIVRLEIRYHMDQIVHGREQPEVHAQLRLSTDSSSDGGMARLTRFLDAARRHANPRSDERVVVCRKYVSGCTWSTYARKRPRALDTVLTTPASVVTELRDDVDRFLRDEPAYIHFAQPHKRVYLLAGPPGTGKSSMIHALAAHLRYDVAVYAFDKRASDHSLANAVADLEPGGSTLLVLEDVDQAMQDERCSLSGLTNVLDGLQCRDRLLVMMTTNHLDRLHKTLLRPGRVDRIVQFRLPNRDCIARLVRRYYAQHAAPHDDTAERVAALLEHQSLSTAALVDFFFQHREDSAPLYDCVERHLPALLERRHADSEARGMYN